MQVDGLTNDEVKSHLQVHFSCTFSSSCITYIHYNNVLMIGFLDQKYRLHTRRVPPTTNASTVEPGAPGGGLWTSQEQCGESSKPSNNSHSSSPQGPLHLAGSSRGTSVTGGDSVEDEDDERSESHSWKSHKHSSKRANDV